MINYTVKMIEIIEKAKNVKQAEENQKNIWKQLKDCYTEKYIIEIDLENIVTEIELLESQKKNSFINNIMSFIHIGNNYKLQQEINIKRKKLEKLKSELQDMQLKINEFQKKDLELSEILNSNIQDYFKIEDNEIVIIDYKNRFKRKEINMNNYRTQDSLDKVFVHCTNFFPKNKTILSNYDGDKILNKKLNYRDVEKEVSFLSHRHEVHFTINARVKNTGAGEGNWDNATIIVIDNYDIHKDEFESLHPSDSWTNGTNFKLSKDSIIMIRIQDKEKLPISDDELSNYNIVYYEGDPTVCLENFLNLNNYSIFETDANYPGHHASTRSTQENTTTNRDKAINFWRDNTYNGKDNIILSEADILMIIDIALTANGIFVEQILHEEQIYKLSKDIDIESFNIFSRFVNFIIGSGLKLTNNGMYTFKSDEEILYDLVNINNSKNLHDIINVDFILNIYKKYKELRKKLDTMSPEQIEHLIAQNKNLINDIQISENKKIKM